MNQVFLFWLIFQKKTDNGKRYKLIISQFISVNLHSKITPTTSQLTLKNHIFKLKNPTISCIYITNKKFKNYVLFVSFCILIDNNNDSYLPISILMDNLRKVGS